MKKILFLIVAATLLSFSAMAQTPVYSFPFDNSYSASVGTGTFTSNTGTSFTADRNGNANSAVSINNTGLSATLAGLPYGSAARSVSMWVKLNAMRVDYNYLYTYGTGTNGGYDGASIRSEERRVGKEC